MTKIPCMLQAASERPEGEAPYALMILFLGLTVVLLGVDLYTAFRGQRRAHIVAALVTVPVFLAAVYYADEVGRYWDFDATLLTIHLVFAITGFFWAFAVVITGILHMFGKMPLKAHKWLALAFVALVLLAAVTGISIFVTGTEKPLPPIPSGR